MERLPDSTLDSVIKLFDRTEETILDECVLTFLKELQENRKAEENGLLVRLPCRVGETIWVIGVMGNPQAEPFEVICMTYRIDKQEDNGVYVYAVGNGRISFFLDDELGKTVFLTQAEAEAKLKEMEGENEN